MVNSRQMIREGIKLDKMEEMFPVLMEETNQIIIITDKTFCIRFVNRSVEKVLGFTKVEMIGRSLYEFIATS